MNPYDPPLSEPAIVSHAEGTAGSIPFRMVLASTFLAKAICFGTFVFFGLLSLLGLGVFINWQKATLLLGAVLLTLISLHASEKYLFRVPLSSWRRSLFAYGAGGILGVIAAAGTGAGLV